MQAGARALFAIALYGTVLMPVVLPAVAWSAPRGERGRRLLAFAGGWIALCTVAGVVRLFTDDGYYAPAHVTFWSHATAGAQRALVLLLAATAAGSASLIAARIGRGPRWAAPALVVVSGALLLAAAAGWGGGTARVVAIVLIAGAAAGAAVLAVGARGRATTLFALIGGAFVTNLVMLTVEIALGLH